MVHKNPFEFNHGPFFGEYGTPTGPYIFVTQFGKSHFTDDPVVGGKYLKMTVRYVQRSHDDEGYCSYYNFSEDDPELPAYVVDDEILTVYMCIPEELCDTDGFLKEIYIDDEKELVKDNEDTEPYYESWTTHSDCRGSGVCNLYDSYVPVRIEYVEIV